ncbi:MAG: phosphotransferase, partial [Pseudonocardiales bacterium]|nr:phosphotransferase [Pseudonocardiales bacterium]
LVVDWVDARTWTPADVADETNLARIAAACRVLHRGPAFARGFDMFALQRRYLDVVRTRGFGLPAGYEAFLPAFERVAAALAARPQPAVPCNNDLLAANVLDDGRRLWLIDYEYAGNGDACFELGNIWSEADLDEALLDVLVEAYYGQRRRHLVARARLLALASAYGWALWGRIQAAVSPLDVDFRAFGAERFERAAAGFTGPALPRLLDEVIRDD